jgi:hypothetical protein
LLFFVYSFFLFLSLCTFPPLPSYSQIFWPHSFDLSVSKWWENQQVQTKEILIAQVKESADGIYKGGAALFPIRPPRWWTMRAVKVWPVRLLPCRATP